jgi:hypothetical protein
MTTPLYYVYPFGENADDLTAIPTPAAGDGSVSYFAGWTDPYELDLLTNPSALPIPRGQMNQLFFDITNNIQEYQQYGAPQWVSAAQNLGVSLPYPIYATVYHSNILYRNLVAANTATPGADATWEVVRTSSSDYVLDTSGAANTLTVPLVPAPAAYFPGMLIEVLVANTNTTATVINVATLGNKAVTYTNTNPLIGGEMPAGGIALLQYDGTRFQLLNPVLPTVKSSVIPSGSPITLTSTTPADVTSFTLPAGRWLVFGNVSCAFAGSATNVFAWCSLTSATLPDGSLYSLTSTTLNTVESTGINTPILPVTSNGSTVVYLSVQSQFGGGAGTACGGLYMERIG